MLPNSQHPDFLKHALNIARVKEVCEIRLKNVLLLCFEDIHISKLMNNMISKFASNVVFSVTCLLGPLSVRQW